MRIESRSRGRRRASSLPDRVVLRQLAVAASDCSVGMVLLVVSLRVFATSAWGGACAVVLSARTLLVLNRSVWFAAWFA